MFIVRRSEHNPILQPNLEKTWESFAAFNMCPWYEGDHAHVLYRAMAESELIEGKRVPFSTIGYARDNGEGLIGRRQFIVPEYGWEKYGCEDPRITKFGDTYYIFYTALGIYPFSAEGIRVAVATTKDFKHIEQKNLVTPFNAKAMALFPEKIGGKYAVIFSAKTDMPPAKMCVALFDKIEDIWSPIYWEKWLKEIDKHEIKGVKRGDNEHIEVGAVPIKTPHGWLLVYSHIQRYNNSDKVFGVEALLLDLKNPLKVVGHTHGPMFVPEETYEEFGHVPNTIFPSGAFLDEGILRICYGAADTTGCVARVNFSDLLDSMQNGPEALERYENNPILSPLPKSVWENKAVFNPAAIRIGKTTHLLYRAMNNDNTSVIGYASTDNGLTVTGRQKKPAYVPRENFEKKLKPGNSGCEDPRLTKIDDKIYMLYTAYDGVDLPGVAVTSILEKDFVRRVWNWTKPTLISPPGQDDKDAALFPEKINGQYYVIHRTYHAICLDSLNSLDSDQPLLGATPIIGPRQGMWDSHKVGLSCPPIKTKAGWFMLYHGIDDAGVYRTGAVLLNLDNPFEVIGRTADYIFEPKKNYEKNGQVNQVVFPCGSVIDKGKLYVYYGGADSVVGVATAPFAEILKKMVL